MKNKKNVIYVDKKSESLEEIINNFIKNYPNELMAIEKGYMTKTDLKDVNAKRKRK